MYQQSNLRLLLRDLLENLNRYILQILIVTVLILYSYYFRMKRYSKFSLQILISTQYVRELFHVGERLGPVAISI